MSESDLSLISDLTLGSCRVRSDLDLGSRYQRRVPLVIPVYPVQSRSQILLSDISDKYCYWFSVSILISDVNIRERDQISIEIEDIGC